MNAAQKLLIGLTVASSFSCQNVIVPQTSVQNNLNDNLKIEEFKSVNVNKKDIDLIV